MRFSIVVLAFLPTLITANAAQGYYVKCRDTKSTESCTKKGVYCRLTSRNTVEIFAPDKAKDCKPNKKYKCNCLPSATPPGYHDPHMQTPEYYHDEFEGNYDSPTK